MSHATASPLPVARARRSLRVPHRARLGDPPLLRRVGNELTYTPTRCRVSASLIIGRINPWWQRLSPERLSGARTCALSPGP
ncbi:hypothetical protein DBB29_16850 [Pandoraea cepalis]|uniref:Uncharacterized protein n=1 Tax=Pandoraea cepalis TaxID=2508294 RepID=A0AAW7MNN0_9BURK|nr:hypothetical protein [Pandoraea cepalis]MDN4574280.1 hypothetical protein [Pandoraea cepalis]MDN4579783.1 hypothetical protein [Pandoraea cepalis]